MGHSPSPKPSPSPPEVDWITFGFNLKRSGFNPHEVVLDVESAPRLHVLWTADIGGPVTAPPVVAAGVKINGEAVTLVLVGTEEGDFFALDAADGQVVWRRDVGSVETDCLEFPEGTHGVTGSAVLDRQTGRVYVAGGTGRVFALDLATGAVVKGWPVTVTREAKKDHVYSALTLAGRLLYAATAGICEPVPYKGKLIAIDVRTAQQAATFFPTGVDGPSGGGIWGAGGVSVDRGSGDVFVATGNARTVPEHYGFAENVIRLSPQLKLKSANYPGVTGVDSDFGATPLLYRAPGCPPQLAVENKDGELFVYERAAIGRGPVQRLQVADAEVEQFQGVPAFSPVTDLVYVSNPSDSSSGRYRHGLLAFEVRKNCTLRLAWQRTFGPNQVIGSPPTVAGGVIYRALGGHRRVYAFNAANGEPLWNSGQTIRGKVFAPPVVVNGRLYEGSWDGRFYAFSA